MCDSSTSQIPAISTFAMRDHALTWLAGPPSPITAIRTRSLGLCEALHGRAPGHYRRIHQEMSSVHRCTCEIVVQNRRNGGPAASS